MIAYRTKLNSCAHEVAPRLEATCVSAPAGGGDDGFDDRKPPHAIIGFAVEEPAHADRDIIYGAQAIADHIFADEPNRKRARRRIFNLAAYYKARNERAGFFKLKGALCLSKKQWRRFHGLG